MFLVGMTSEEPSALLTVTSFCPVMVPWPSTLVTWEGGREGERERASDQSSSLCSTEAAIYLQFYPPFLTVYKLATQ